MRRRPRRSRDLSGQRVFVTGAASGIGRALARQVAAEGGVLHLTDLQADRLTEVVDEVRASGGAVSFAEAADISSYDEVQAMSARLTSTCGAMDVVMNVAGIATWGTVRSLEHADWRQVVDVNLMGPIHVIETLLPPMIDAGRGGHLVNVSSAAGIVGLPWHAAYSASKFGLRGVSEVLRFDLRKHGIGVSLVCPGGVDTGLTESVRIAGVDTQTPRFRRLVGHFRRRAATPDAAAAAILEGVRRNRYWVYTSPDIRFAHWGQRHFPRLYALTMRAMNGGANRVLPEVERACRPDLPGVGR